MQPHIRISLTVVFRYFIWLWLTVCAYPLLAAPQKPALEKVSLQLKWLHQFQFAGYYAAKEKGFYAAEGLEVEIQPHRFNTDDVEQVLKGQSQYGISDTSLLQHRLNGKPLVMLAAIFQHNPLVYLSLKSSGIKSPYELKNKRIMESSQSNASLQGMFYEVGMSAQDYIRVDYNSDVVESLTTGKTDAVAAYLTSELSYFKQHNIEVNIIDPRNYGIDFSGDNLFTTEQEIKNHPKRVEKFLRASLKGWDYALKYPEEIIQLILKKYNPEQRLSGKNLRFEAEEIRKMIMPDAVPIGTISAKRLERTAQTYQQLGLVNSTDRLEGFIYHPVEQQKLNLTDEEKAWLKAHPVIRVGIDKDFAPYEWTDKNGNSLGISSSYLNLLEQRLGIKFEVVKDKSWTQVLEMSEHGEVDMLAAANQTPEREQYLNFTSVYVEAPVIIVTNAKKSFIGYLSRLNGKRVVVEKGYFMQELLQQNHPKIQLIPVKNRAKALQMVNSGQADAYIGDAIATTYTLQQEKLSGLIFSGDTGYKSRHRMAAIKKHPLLIKILNKALTNIPKSEQTRIQNQWMNFQKPTEINFKQFIHYIIAGVVLFGFILIWNMRLQSEIKRRKQIEAQLRGSEQQLQSVLTGGYIGFWDWNILTNHVERNSIWAEMLGYTYNEIQSTTQQWLDFIYPDDRQKAWQSILEVLSGHKTYHALEYRMLHKDGSIKWIFDRASIVQWDNTGKPTRMSGTHTDITEQKKIELSLQQSEERLRTIFQKSYDANVLVVEGVIVDCNEAALEMFQASREQIIGKSPGELAPEKQPDGQLSTQSAAKHISAILDNGSAKFEWQHQRSNGSNFWAEVVVTRINIDGKIGLFGVLRDISKRKEAETALRIAAQVFEAQEGIIITDSNGSILKVNQAFTQITGYSSDEVVGKNPRFLSSGRQKMLFYAQLWKSVYQSGSWQGEIWNKRKNGEIYPQQLTITAVTTGEEEQISHYVAIFSDITERKKIEQAMQEAETKAILASEAKSEFLANMSHEIRTPMNAIIGMLHLIQRTELTAKQRNYVNKIDFSTQSLLNIINDILDFSKIEAGKLKLEESLFSLDDILNYVSDIIDLKAKQKKIVILFLVSPQTPHHLIGDSLRLTQVLINLVSNAVKFTEKGKIIVSVTPETLQEQQVCLRFSVEDSGIGMSEEQINGLFLPFSQADSSITRKYGGSGLGLVISKQLVELMGGQIWVESQLNKGSIFSFTVNLGVSSKKALAVKRGESPLQNNFNGRHVLVVEDNEINRELAIELLGELGIKVETAENGKQGVERINNEAFDLVLMDIQMPEMDGLTATRLIRTNEKFHDLPIIAMTAHALNGDREKSLTAGMNDHLTKPIDLPKLIEVLSYWLAEKPLQHGEIVEKKQDLPFLTAEKDIPKELDGFDIPTVLLRLRGNTKLLRKVLLMFYRDFHDGAEKLRDLADNKNYHEASRFAHTIKGVAASLEAKELLMLASQAEQIFANEELDKIPEVLDNFAHALQKAISAIATLDNLAEQQNN